MRGSLSRRSRWRCWNGRSAMPTAPRSRSRRCLGSTCTRSSAPATRPGCAGATQTRTGLTAGNCASTPDPSRSSRICSPRTTSAAATSWCSTTPRSRCTAWSPGPPRSSACPRCGPACSARATSRRARSRACRRCSSTWASPRCSRSSSTPGTTRRCCSSSSRWPRSGRCSRS